MALRIIVLLLAMAIVPFAALAHEEKDVESLVRAYFAAFQKQEWDTLTDMMHPKSLEGLRDAILAKVPERSADIVESQRTELDELLSMLSVKTPEAARRLSPKEVYLRMLRRSSANEAGNALKNVKTEIKSVSIRKTGEEYHADVDAESEFRDKVFSGTTHFIVESLDGTLKVVAMTKSNKPRR